MVHRPKMKQILTLLIILLIAAGVILAVSFFAPLPIPYYQDFSVTYFTSQGRLNGIHIYDYPTQLAFVKTLTPSDFTFHPYPYPPWYALATLYLGWLPIQVAARTWFFLNLAMIGGAAWLLTPGWKVIPRILGAFAAIMFIPAFGLLIVGQYSAPVLLGAALFIWSAQKKSAAWAAVALLLMTFKPHIGGILFLAGFGWLLYQCRPWHRPHTPRSSRGRWQVCERAAFWQAKQPPVQREIASPLEEQRLATTSFARRALWLTILGGMILAIVGFLADPAWPLSYLQSLGRYRDIPGVQTCGLCASLSVALVRVATGQSNTGTAAWVSLVLAMGIVILLLWRYQIYLKDPTALMVLSAILTLLLDPYLLNYDYVLLLIPLLWLVRRERLAALAYFIPWAALALGRDGNVLLPVAALLLLTILWKKRDKLILPG
jgi:hypothetical protein